MDLSAFAADPIAVGTIIGALALVMFAAAWHKLSEPDVFAGSLAAYRLLPQALVTPVARLLPLAEAALGAGILLPATRPIALLLLAGLVLVYGTAMAINLLRGRHDPQVVPPQPGRRPSGRRRCPVRGRSGPR